VTVFATAGDITAQRSVAADLERAWRWTLHPFGALDAIDYYALEAGRLAAYVEIKCRTHDAGTYPTVFLAVRKWLALALAEAYQHVPGVYVVRFADGIRWIACRDIDASHVRIAGRPPRGGAVNDREPIIDVPVDAMTRLRRAS
jgi:hypothetical protein